MLQGLMFHIEYGMVKAFSIMVLIVIILFPRLLICFVYTSSSVMV